MQKLKIYFWVVLCFFQIPVCKYKTTKDGERYCARCYPEGSKEDDSR